MKSAKFLGNSLKVIRGFPATAKQCIGNEIHRLQRGADPTAMRPMREVGAGVFEIRVREELSWFRAFYVSKFEDDIYILHAFEKKRNRTAPKDIKAGKKIYNELVRQKQKE
tara:strand:+ start:503 stop:835 length:333 start_codon:yes stop_codon:yes gene_type:complete